MPRVRDYFDNAIRVAKRNNYSSTLMGRRRTLWMINSMYDGDVAEGERKIKNSPIQGTAQDIVKWAMKRLHEDHLLTSMGSRLLLQIHDELVWEVPSEFVENDAFVKRAKEVMCDPFGGSLLSVALDTSHKYGKTLLETK
jgi:DNA polymerase-1